MTKIYTAEFGSRWGILTLTFTMEGDVSQKSLETEANWRRDCQVRRPTEWLLNSVKES